MGVIAPPTGARISGFIVLYVGEGPGFYLDALGNSTNVPRTVPIFRMPLPDAQWDEDVAYIDLKYASGFSNVDQHTIDASYRAMTVHLAVSPVDSLTACHSMDLHWKQPASMVVSVLTDGNPYDLEPHYAPPGLHPYYVAISTGTPGDALDNLGRSDVRYHSDTEFVQLPDAPVGRWHIAFAVIEPIGEINDIRQVDSSFNTRVAFTPAIGTDAIRRIEGDVIGLSLIHISEPTRPY